MNLPLLTTNVNVYCDGVYDLCHIGHKNLFKSALKFGTRLYVGVVGDKDAMNYKRPPIMSMEERAAEVCSMCCAVCAVHFLLVCMYQPVSVACVCVCCAFHVHICMCVFTLLMYNPGFLL